MNIIQVQARLMDPLNLPTDKADSLKEIQWMPPGKHSVWPDGFEKPFEQEVVPAIAQVAAAGLQSLRSQAAAGNGNWPYLDFNHEDREQSGEPLEFSWGGSDPKTGGVRLKLKWSGAGERAVRARDFRSFSPSWRMHKETHAFLGVGLNMGGLVNRSAFKTIAAVSARGVLVNASPPERWQTDHELFQRAHALALKEGIGDSMALSRVIQEEPALWADYIATLTGHAGAIPNPVTVEASSASHSFITGATAKQLPFLVGAYVYAKAKGIEPEDAHVKFAGTAKGRALYEDYRQ